MNEPAPTRLALKVDVDTYDGLRQGGPGILDVLSRRGVRATFFVSFGPDNSGKAIMRVFRRKGFLKKMLRTNAARMYGFKTMLRGTLLPAPLIGASMPDLVRRMDAEGHEVGVHAWDHQRWQDGLARIGGEGVRAELARAFDAYEAALGRRPRATAAPGWQADEASLAVLDELGLDYASDSRGTHPFRPAAGVRVFRTPQVPTTLGTLDEDLGRAVDEPAYADWLAQRVPQGRTSVLTVHTETEGMAFAPVFDRFLGRVKDRGVELVPVCQVIQGPGPGSAGAGGDLPVHRLVWGQVAGRAGPVATQGERVELKGSLS